ncbi:6346_t:CDS:2, partial [Funneliformis geosporum]
MSDDKGSLEYLPIYSFLFLNVKGSSLYNAYDRDDVENKLVIKINQDDRAPKFSVADDVSEVYGLSEIHECINGQKPLRAIIDIDAIHDDMKANGVNWEDILKGLVITILSDPSKSSYHILYAPALLIDHHELKAFTELVHTLTGKKFGKYIDQGLLSQNFNLRLIGSAKKGHVKHILQFSLDNGWNELEYARVQPPTSLGLEVKVLGFPKAFLKFPSWVKYDDPLIATEIYEKRYVRPLPNKGDIYVGSPWETEKTYILEHLTISDDVNLLRVVCQIESLHRITNNCKCNKKCKCLPIQYDLWIDEIVFIIAQAQSRLADQSIKKLYKLIQEARRIIPQKSKMFRLAPNKEIVLAELWDWAKQMISLPFEEWKSTSLICHLRKNIQGIVHALKTDFQNYESRNIM